jgi:hypothetical protein
MNNLYALRQQHLREIHRLTQEIQKQHVRIAHRTHLWRHQQIPTAPEKRQVMAERLHELMVLRNIESSAADSIHQKILHLKGFPSWCWSDLMLANLTTLVETKADPKLVTEARAMTRAMFNDPKASAKR